MNDNNNNKEEEEQQQQQQPVLKKIKIDNNEIDDNKLKKKIEKEILMKYDFQDYGISNFLKIFNLFELYPKYELIRSRSVNYVNQYHIGKIPQLVDVYNFIKFIVNAFFDSSNLVFDEIKKIKTMNSKILLSKIYLKILNDKRFNQSDEYQKRMIELEEKGELFHAYICRVIKKQFNTDSNDNTINVDNSSSTSSSSSNRNVYYLQNYLIDKIIEYIMYSHPTNNWECIIESNQEIFNLSLVSKQFFKVLSNQLMKRESIHSFPFLMPIYESNGNGESWRLFYQLPIELDYESLKHIKYNWNENQLNSIFSKVEIFTISPDEYDHGKDCDEIVRNDIYDYYDYDEVRFYQETVIKEEFIIYPPVMPSLKSLLINDYYGYQNNISDLISYIFKINSSSSSNTTSSSSNYIGKIEHFSIVIESLGYRRSYSEFNFFSDLFKYHSNSLKLIEIDCCFDRFYSILEFFRVYNSFKNYISNKIKIELFINGDNINTYDSVDSILMEVEEDIIRTGEREYLNELLIYFKNQK